MKKYLVLFATMLTAVCLAFVAACAPDDAQKTVESLKVDASKAKTEFVVNEQFTYNGLEVKAVYSDKSESAVTGYTVAPPDMSTAGEKDVTVSYQQKTATYKITVSELELTGITLNTDKAPKTFRVGDTFSYEGLIVTANYADNSSKAVTGYTVSTPDLTSTGEKTVTVTYEGKTATYTVNVVEAGAEPQLTGISVTLTKNYAEQNGEVELTVTAEYDIGGNKTLTASDYQLTADLSEIGETEITVKYSTFTETATVWVVPVEDDLFGTLDFTAENSENELLLYLTEFDTTDGKGTGNGSPSLAKGWYFFTFAEDGSHYMATFECNHAGAVGGWGTTFTSGDEAITAGLVWDDAPAHASELEVKYNNVNYYADGQKTRARVLGWTDEARSVTIGGIETTYKKGAAFSAEGVTVNANLKSGENADITEKCTVTVKTAPDMSKIGNQTVELNIVYTYDDYGIERTQNINQSVEILVLPDVPVTDTIAFPSGANGETLTLYVTARTGGGSLDADATANGSLIYHDAQGYVTLTFAYTYTATGQTRSMTISEEGFTATFAEGKLTIAHGEVTFSAEANVVNTILNHLEKQFTGVRWLETREYVVGATLSAPVRTFSDGSTEALQENEYTATTVDMNTVGVKEITFAYTAKDEYADKAEGATIQIICIPAVDWDTNRLEFGADKNGSGATLELFIENRSVPSGGYWGTEQVSTGWLLVRNADGSFEMYEYKFKLGSDVVSHPYPDNPTGGDPNATGGSSADGKVTSRVPGGSEDYHDCLVVEVGGKLFAAEDGNRWHLVLFGWQ